ncbi:MAG: hypothetical protein Q7T56_18860 [Nocardioidaceae bacterium]|nr:hypothetical protein [Nocardioidaceae bacterium]
MRLVLDDRTRAAAAVAASGAAVVAALVGAAGLRWVLLAALLAVAAAGAVASEATEHSTGWRRLSLNGTWRWCLCWVGVVACGVTTWESRWVAPVVVVGAIALSAVRGVGLLAVGRVARSRQLDAETRNVDLSSLRLPPAPPVELLRRGDRVQAGLPVVLLAPAAVLDDPVVIGVLAVLAVAGAAGWTAWTLRLARQVSKARGHQALDLVRRFLDEHAPEVVLYHAESAAGAYQVDVWLSTMERLPRRTVVLVRSAAAMRRMGTTTLPVVCVPRTVDFLSLPFTTVRAALYVANVGPNLHLLRLPHVRSAFVGHGDSDKSASVNPFAKVYDELWVAGPAARERWHRADVGVDVDTVVEVGRPQLDRLGPRPDGADAAPAAPVRTVLYAPTWEGWNATQEYGSVAFQGPDVVRALIDSPTPVRVVYKPHPLTGTRDRAAAAGHAEIVAMLRRANEERSSWQPPPFSAPFQSPLAAAHDAAEASVLAGREGVMVSAVEAETSLQDAQRRYLAGLRPDAHLVVEGSDLDLYALFELADVLVTDVSSVLTDFQATGRPYATCNTTPATGPGFAAQFPASRAGVVIGRDGSGTDELVAVAGDPAADTRAGDRALLRRELLGDTSEPSQARFDAAVDALVASGDERALRFPPPRTAPE